ncbi:helix-turn-helix transcriptional regulator [Devosia sp.]|uniref:LexA family transcriptional regulator n=1 Tax=Devosia sp. TaxID=1871048 RepID=UPI001B0539D3|nr:helix-turn-helix transcriptional regulator [Devosia sp.]MBO9589567.1 helix-turn-helix transcriptional regulator [Devosia sp.]
MSKELERKEREERAARLVAARKAAGHTSAVKAAEAFGWNVNSYKAHEAGRNGFGIADARSYADAFGTTPEYLNFGSADGNDVRLAPQVPLLPVVVNGKVAAGVYREANEFDQSAPERVWEPPDERFPNARRMAWDVEGNSMDRLEPRPILPGDRIIGVAYEDVAQQVRIKDGLVVVVERTRDGGHTREWSVKQIELYEDRIEFHPRSSDKSLKPIVVKRDAQADDGVSVEIIALVRSVRNDLPL